MRVNGAERDLEGQIEVFQVTNGGSDYKQMNRGTKEEEAQSSLGSVAC